MSNGESGTARTRPKAYRGAWYHHWLLPLVVLAFAWLIAAWCFKPPPPQPNSAPRDRFAAARAQRVLREVFGDERPHPVGSARNAEVRQRLLVELRALGLKPSVQRGFACSQRGVCATVHNLVAVIEGTASKSEAVLLCAHYDSVPAGPGIGDDATGVAAVLETARALLSGPRPQHDVVLLLDDGEEAGLLGARAFMRDHPLSRRIRAAVNIEARGSGGASLMFESEGHSETLMAILDEVDRPLTSSLFVDVYRRLPNDTDFTVFRRYGVAGFNLAYIDQVSHYHTPLDNLANNSQASLQHHGDNALQLVRALDHADLNELAAGGGPQLVWFDWLGKTLASMPVYAARGLALGLLVLFGFLTLVWAWCAPQRGLNILKALLGFWVALVVPMLSLAVMVELAKALKGTATPWMGYPQVYITVMVIAAFAATAALGHWLRTARGWMVYGLMWSQWAVLGVMVAEWMPAATHLFIVPCAAAAVCGVVGVVARREERTWSGRLLLMLPVFVTVTIWGRVVIGLVQVAGLWLYPAVVLAFALPLITALPTLASQPPREVRQLLYGAGALIAIVGVVGLAAPAFSQSAPQRMSIAHLQRDNGEAGWMVDASWGPLPDALVERGTLGEPGPAPLPGLGTRLAAYGAAKPVKASPAQLNLVAVNHHDNTTKMRLRLVSPRRSHTVMFLIPPRVPLHGISVDGHPLSMRSLSDSPIWPGHRYAIYLTLAPSGADLEFSLERGAALKFEVLEVSPGLPPLAAPLLMARGRSATPSQHGDISIVATQVAFASDAHVEGQTPPAAASGTPVPSSSAPTDDQVGNPAGDGMQP